MPLIDQVVLGRKEWIILGSDTAGYLAAELMSLVRGVHHTHLSRFVDVNDVLDHLLAGMTNSDALRPDV